MEKLVSTTFKILALSMLFMFLLDTTLLVVEIVTIHSKVSNITGIIQTEIARNNYLPTEMANTFENYLYGVVENSRVIEDPHTDVRTNFTSSLSVPTSAYAYDALTAANAKEYGEIANLAILVTIHPAFVYYNNSRNAADQSWLHRGPSMQYDLTYTYQIPCLRYLK